MTHKFEVGDKVRCVDARGALYGALEKGWTYYVHGLLGDGKAVQVEENGTAFNVDRFVLAELYKTNDTPDSFVVGQDVLAAIGVTRNLKRAIVTDLLAGKDNQGNNLVGIFIDGMNVLVPEDKLYTVP